MINSEDALKRVQDGAAPEDWHVHYAKKDFFVEQAFICFLLLFVLIAFLVWYILNPHMIVMRGFLLDWLPGPLRTFIIANFSGFLHFSNTQLWRILDYLSAAIVGGFLLLVGLDGIENAKKPHAQLLLIRPDGLILKQEENKTTVIDYKALSDLIISEYKDDKVKLALINKEDGEEKTLALDKRFGDPRKLARDILKAYQDQQAGEARR
ncbi:hypothetical protein EPA93_06200 [Ktedonosporobacter rubrisoli]|uniref:Uncharacterized protein n=1 Tax=Ktedonosporobacter rubrisoli TaxID=2509675 RepID=A0A4P6JKD0_KTERU|nr:hypothetical protein [Ktedonosporobacter rubrisoli]QBD75618.1 hypothetical protein EPA93_06200 [Ktedonosporobacter rubrisoli]